MQKRRREGEKQHKLPNKLQAEPPIKEVCAAFSHLHAKKNIYTHILGKKRTVFGQTDIAIAAVQALAVMFAFVPAEYSISKFETLNSFGHA